jgi:hypothetical protein
MENRCIKLGYFLELPSLQVIHNCHDVLPAPRILVILLPNAFIVGGP